MGRLAIIAGAGRLPQLLADHCVRRGANAVLVRFAGVDGLDWTDARSPVAARFEAPQALFDVLRGMGVTEVVFAGAMNRPALDPAAFDATLARYAPRLLPALGSGDNAVLSLVVEMFTDAGFTVIAPDAVLPALAAEPGVLTLTRPSDEDLSDAARAARIVAALGALDIGQGAVVAQGLCLATETLPGTDAMLAFVASLDRSRLPRPDGPKGVLFKGPKPGQDRRIDLPAIGPGTVALAARAGLAGMALEAGGILLIDRDTLIAAADDAGLFVVVRDRVAP